MSVVFCWNLIGNCRVCFDFWWGAPGAGSLVGSLVSSLVGSLVGSWVGSLVGSSVSSLLGSSGSGYRCGFTVVVLKLVGLLGSCTLHVSLTILSNLNRPVYLPLYLVLPFHYMSISELR